MVLGTVAILYSNLTAPGDAARFGYGDCAEVSCDSISWSRHAQELRARSILRHSISGTRTKGAGINGFRIIALHYLA